MFFSHTVGGLGRSVRTYFSPFLYNKSSLLEVLNRHMVALASLH